MPALRARGNAALRLLAITTQYCFCEAEDESALLARQARHPLRHRSRSVRSKHPRDAIIKVTSVRDLRLRPAPLRRLHARHESGDIIGHEFMGEVVEVGTGNKKLKVGDRVVVPFTICCGECEQCRRGNFSVCERTNRNKESGRQGVRPHHRRAVRLHAPHRRLCRRPGRVRARAVRGRRAGQDPGRADRRAGAVPRRHLPDRLAGRGAVRHPADRHGRGLGRGPGRPVRASAAPCCSARAR